MLWLLKEIVVNPHDKNLCSYCKAYYRRLSNDTERCLSYNVKLMKGYKIAYSLNF